ncbi:unnamed protein product, partial [Prorocentrum cordatum]
ELERGVEEAAAAWRRSVCEAVGEGQKLPSPRFAIAFVPERWSARLPEVVRSLMALTGWPKFAPFLGVLSESSSLTLCASLAPAAADDTPRDSLAPRLPSPRVFFWGGKELQHVSELALNPELHTKTGAAGMSLNGTALAAHAYLQREPHEVGSFLLFGDFAAGAGVINRCLSILDVSYPKATKAGVVAPRAGSDPPLAVGFRGRVTQNRGGGGLLGLALPGAIHTSLGLCGCRPVGVPLEVHDADLQQRVGAFIRTVGSAEWDGDSWGVPGVEESKTPTPPRRRSQPAAPALREAAARAGFAGDADLWVGVPRKLRVEERSFKSAPGAGEWALYPWAVTSSEGSVVLQGEGPRADGIGKKGVRKVQGFVTQADPRAIESLDRSYKLLFAGGPGATASVGDEAAFDGCGLGLAVIGNGGLTVGEDSRMEGTGTFTYANAQRPTLLHRQ